MSRRGFTERGEVSAEEVAKQVGDLRRVLRKQVMFLVCLDVVGAILIPLFHDLTVRAGSQEVFSFVGFLGQMIGYGFIVLGSMRVLKIVSTIRKIGNLRNQKIRN